MNGNVLWITAPLQLINKTPSTLTIRQHGLLTIVSPVSKPSDSLLATTPLVHVDTPSEKLRMSSSPPLLCPCLRSRSFENQLDALEAQLKSRPFVSTDSDSDETLFSCLVALPTNQKEVIVLPVRVNTTFEDLLVACWKNTYPSDPSPSPHDYYFLHLLPQHIVRVEMGECVRDFRNSPRFLLRSVYHGIEGSYSECRWTGAHLRNRKGHSARMRGIRHLGGNKFPRVIYGCRGRGSFSRRATDERVATPRLCRSVFLYELNGSLTCR